MLLQSLGCVGFANKQYYIYEFLNNYVHNIYLNFYKLIEIILYIYILYIIN